MQQSALSHVCLLRDTCCHIQLYIYMSVWEVPIVETINQCPLPLWMTCTNSVGSTVKFIVLLVHNTHSADQRVPGKPASKASDLHQ